MLRLYYLIVVLRLFGGLGIFVLLFVQELLFQQ